MRLVKNGFIGILFLALSLYSSTVFAYDVTFNFEQTYPELVSGWKIKASPTKGGPYTLIQDCAKTAIRSDKTFDCKGTGYAINPAYVVLAPYDSASKELAQSSEVTVSVTVPAPTNIKTVVTVTTTTTVGRNGKVSSETMVAKKDVPQNSVVSEGTVTTRTKDGKYVTVTTIVMG